MIETANHRGKATVREGNPSIYGECVRRVEVGGFILGDNLRPPGLTIPAHADKLTNIVLALEGTFIETIGKNSHSCDPFSLLLRPAGELHSSRFGPAGARNLNIQIKPQRLEMIRELSPVLDQPLHIRERALPVLVRRLARELRLMDDASALAIESLVLEILAQATRRGVGNSSSPAPRWLGEVRDLLHESFSQKLSLTHIASVVDVHPTHLAKMFRKHYHCTVGEYLRRLRLEFAIAQLPQSEKPLAEIAVAAGFYDQSHFTNAFKLHYGITPTEFRATLQPHKPDTNRPRLSKTR